MATQIEEGQMQPEPRFKFGENWASYATGVAEEQIAMAEVGLRRLLSDGTLAGKRFLDIGCGSGLHSVAAARLGATEIIAVDIDPISVDTTRRLVATHAPRAGVRVEKRSVFDLSPEELGTFDVVYSWGALHHTGNMAKAIRRAAALVANSGELALALYGRTWLCPLWKLEKRWYAGASQRSQERARRAYVSLYRLAYALTGRNFQEYIEGYKGARGMDYHHDVHDWLGGYPYESTSRFEIEDVMRPLGFKIRLAPKRRLRRVGLFGSVCDEYVYSRTCPATAPAPGLTAGPATGTKHRVGRP